MGGSNGGLLMGDMLTLNVPIFSGPIVCEVPLLDMKRYHKLLAGASWMAEYGDPDEPKEWDFIAQVLSLPQRDRQREISAHVLHDLDARRPRASRTRTQDGGAGCIEMGHDVVLYENIEGGHGGAADNKQRAFMSALAYTFLWKQAR